MAVPHQAKIINLEKHGEACLITMKMLGKPFSFFGGQFLIVDTGLTLPTGEKYKRAYSLVGEDHGEAEPQETLPQEALPQEALLQIAVYCLPKGKGSHHLHQRHVGDIMTFSGPWGKFHGGKFHANKQKPLSAFQEIIFVATDTGITAALGFLRSATMLPWCKRTTLLWFFRHAFIPEKTLREWLPKDLAYVELLTNKETFLTHAKSLIKRSTKGIVFLCGDGEINHLLEKECSSKGVLIGGVENFFHAPKKAPSAQKNLSSKTPE